MHAIQCVNSLKKVIFTFLLCLTQISKMAQLWASSEDRTHCTSKSPLANHCFIEKQTCVGHLLMIKHTTELLCHLRYSLVREKTRCCYLFSLVWSMSAYGVRHSVMIKLTTVLCLAGIDGSPFLHDVCMCASVSVHLYVSMSLSPSVRFRSRD